MTGPPLVVASQLTFPEQSLSSTLLGAQAWPKARPSNQCPKAKKGKKAQERRARH